MPMVRLTPLAVLLVLPVLTAGGDHPVGDHVHGAIEVEVLPLGAVRAPVLDLYSRLEPVVSCRLAEPFGHSRPRLTGRVGVTLDLR